MSKGTRSNPVQVNLTLGEKKRIAAAAALEGLPLSSFLRVAALREVARMGELAPQRRGVEVQRWEP